MISRSQFLKVMELQQVGYVDAPDDNATSPAERPVGDPTPMQAPDGTVVEVRSDGSVHPLNRPLSG